MWTTAFLSLGFLIGTLVGFSAHSVVTSLLGLLFAFAGGSALAFVQKVTPENRQLATHAVMALSIACLAGVYSGIYVAEHQLLTPLEYRQAARKAQPAGSKYVRSNFMSVMDGLDSELRQENITAEEAFRQAYDFIQRTERTNGK